MRFPRVKWSLDVVNCGKIFGAHTYVCYRKVSEPQYKQFFTSNIKTVHSRFNICCTPIVYELYKSVSTVCFYLIIFRAIYMQTNANQTKYIYDMKIEFSVSGNGYDLH